MMEISFDPTLPENLPAALVQAVLRLCLSRDDLKQIDVVHHEDRRGASLYWYGASDEGITSVDFAGHGRTGAQNAGGVVFPETTPPAKF
jgi:hypothetical protein